MTPRPPDAPPAVSVIIPTYNRSALLLETLGSVFAQTFADYEVIVVDDGSPDDTQAVLAPLVAEGRVRSLTQANGGLSAARNTGLAEARGEFVAWIDDDDLWPADKLAVQVAALRARPAAVMHYGASEKFGALRRPPWPAAGAPDGPAYEAFVRGNWILSIGAALVRTAAARAAGAFDADIPAIEDWDFYLRLAKLGEFAFDPVCVLHYRTHPHNATNDWRRMRHSALRVVAKHFGRLPRPGNLRRWWLARRFVGQYISGQLARSARQAEEAGNWPAARRQWLSAAWVRPTILHVPQTRARVARALLPWAAAPEKVIGGES